MMALSESGRLSVIQKIPLSISVRSGDAMFTAAALYSSGVGVAPGFTGIGTGKAAAGVLVTITTGAGGVGSDEKVAVGKGRGVGVGGAAVGGGA